MQAPLITIAERRAPHFGVCLLLSTNESYSMLHMQAFNDTSTFSFNGSRLDQHAKAEAASTFIRTHAIAY